MSYSSVVLSRAPSGYWHFDETSGTVVDSSGNNLTAVVVGTVNFNQAGATRNTGTSFNFPGGTTDGVSISDNAVIDFATDFTLLAWFKTSINDGTQTFIMDRTTAGGSGTGYAMVFLNGKVGFYFGNTRHDTPATYADDNWHMAVCTLAGSAWKIYIDATLVASGTEAPSLTASHALKFGNAGAFAGFRGNIDEPAVFPSALSQSDINAIYSAAVAKPGNSWLVNPSDTNGLAANLVAAHAMLEGTGTVAADLANLLGTYTGTIVNGVTWGTGTGSDAALNFNAAGAFLTLAPINSPSTVPIQLAAGSNWSVAWRGKQTNADAQGSICGLRTGSSDLIWFSGGNTVTYRSAGGTLQSWTGLTTTTTADYLLTYDGTNLRLYVNGSLASAKALASARLYMNAIGHAYNNDANSLIGQLEYFYVWSATKTSGHANNLHLDPYQFLQSPPAASASTPSYTITLSAASGTSHAPITVTVAPVGTYTGTITLAATGAHLEEGDSQAFVFSSPSARPAAITRTITPIGTGTLTLTPSSTNGLNDPSAATYTLAATKPTGALSVNGGNAYAANLAHAWLWDEGTGSTVTDVAATPSALNGTLNASAVRTTDRDKNKVYFPNSGASATIDCTVTSTVIPTSLSTTTYTIVWRCPQSANNTAGMVLNNGSNYLWQQGTTINLRDSSGGAVTLTGGGGSVISDYTSLSNVFALTYDNSVYKFYVNGVLAATSATFASRTFTFSKICGLYSGSIYFAGNADFIYIYSDVKSAADLAAIAASPYQMISGAALFPGWLSITAQSSTSASLAMTTPAGGTTNYSYQLQRSTDGLTGWTDIGSAQTGQTGASTFTDSTASANVLYYYRVKITDAAGTPSVIFTNVVSGTVTITNPVANKGYRRLTATTGSVIASGTCDPSTTSIDLSTDNTNWTTFGGQSGGTWSATLTGVTAGVDFTLYARKTACTGVVTSVASIRVGDVVVIGWQSNGEGRLQNARSFTANGTVKGGKYNQLGAWGLLADPTDAIDTSVYAIQGASASGTSAGSYWPALGTMWAADQSMPLTFITCADGGTGMTATAVYPDSAWQPPYGNCYMNMLRQIQAAGTNGVTAIIMDGGEADMPSATMAQFKTAIEAFVTQVQTDVPGAPVVIFNQPGNSVTGPSSTAGTDNTSRAITSAADDGANSGHALFNKIFAGAIICDFSTILHPGSDTSGNAAIVERRKAGQNFLTLRNILGTATSVLPRMKVVSATVAPGGTVIKVTFNQPIKTGLTFDTTLWAASDSGGAKTISSVAYHASDPNAVNVTVSAAILNTPTVSYSLGGSQSGKVNVQSADFTLPASYGTLNVPAERFSAFPIDIVAPVVGHSTSPFGVGTIGIGIGV